MCLKHLASIQINITSCIYPVLLFHALLKFYLLLLNPMVTVLARVIIARSLLCLLRMFCSYCTCTYLHQVNASAFCFGHCSVQTFWWFLPAYMYMCINGDFIGSLASCALTAYSLHQWQSQETLLATLNIILIILFNSTFERNFIMFKSIQTRVKRFSQYLKTE